MVHAAKASGPPYGRNEETRVLAQITTGQWRRHGNPGWALMVLCLAALASMPAGAASTTVYKCFDRNLGVLYTDEPCQGEPMSIRAGEPDLVALADLQRERDALSRSIERRIADQRRAALARDLAAQQSYALQPDASAYAGGDVYYPASYGWVPHFSAKPPRFDRARPFERRERVGFLPNPPRGLPRN